MLVDTHGDYLGSWCNRKLVVYQIFGLRLLKQCLQKVSPSAFGSLDPLSKTEFIITRLKGAKHRDWMMSHFGLRRAIVTRELSMPSLLELVSNIVCVLLLIVVYIKQTGRRTDGDCLVVNYILHLHSSCNFFHLHIMLFVLEESIRWLLPYRPDGKEQITPVSLDPRNK